MKYFNFANNVRVLRKTNRPNVFLLLKLSHELDDLFIVCIYLSLHGAVNINVLFAE